MNENEREYEGVKLVVKEQEGCKGCYFDNQEKSSGCFQSRCIPGRRRDKKTIIWIEKQIESQPKTSTPSRQERIAKAFTITTGKDLSADDIDLIEFLAKKIK